MTAFVALVRAVNVGGTGKLSKEELKAIGEACGFDHVRTFINSGNLLFTSDLGESTVRKRIEEKLTDHFGKPAVVYVRSAQEMTEVVKENPFANFKSSRVIAHFIDEKPVQAMIDEARDVQGECLALGPGVIYVSYDEGIGKSKLKLPAVKQGTARNMNSVTRMAELLAGME